MKVPTPPIGRRTAMGTLAGGALGYGASMAARDADPDPDPDPARAEREMASLLNSDNRLVAKLMERPSVRDKGAKGDGVAMDGAAIQDALRAYDTLWVPPGEYLVDVPLVIPSFCILTFASGAIFRPASDGMSVFRTDGASYGSQIIAPRIHAKGKSGITAFDLTNFRHRAEISHADIYGCAKGIVLRSLCWDTLIHMPWTRETKEPLVIMDGSNAVDVVHPAIDRCDIGIRIAGGHDQATTSVRIWGGYVQNGVHGVVDEGAIGTIVDGTYFEGFRDGDILLSRSIRTNVSRTQHFGNGGVAAIRMQGVDGATVFDPLMGSGTRTIGLYDIDEASSNVTRFEADTKSGMNAPLGNIARSMVVTREAGGGFKPVLSLARGSPRYSRQRGRWRRAGDELAISFDLSWANAPTGQELIVSGLEAALRLSADPTGAIAPTVLVGAPVGTVYGRMDSDTHIRFFVATDGKERPCPLPATGSLSFSLSCLL